MAGRYWMWLNPFRSNIVCGECGCRIVAEAWPIHEKWHANVAEAIDPLARQSAKARR